MKEAWQTKKLTDVCQFLSGLWKGEQPPFVNVGVIRNTNFTREGNLNDADIAYLDVEARKFEKRRLQFGDIILEKSGGGPKQAVGRVVLFDKESGDFSFSNFTSALRVIDPKSLDFRFLHKFLHWTYLSGVTEGMQSNSTGIRNLNGDAYKAIEVAFPPLPEQHRIVGILDEAFDGIATAKANAEKNLQNARALFDSYLEAVFSQRGEGWVEKPFNDVCTFVRGPFGGSLTKAIFVTDGYAVYEQQHAIYNQFDEVRYFVDEAKFREMRRFELLPNDIIMSCSGTMGRIAIVPNGVKRGIINQALLKLTPTTKALSTYLKLWMESEAFQDALKAYSGGAAIQNVASVKVLKEINVPLPSTDEQGRIVEKIEAFAEEIQRLEALYRQKLAALEELKKALLHQAFGGEL